MPGFRFIAGFGAAALVVVLLSPGSGIGAQDNSGAEFTASKTVTRSNLAADGSQTVVATNNVKVSVSQISALRGRQDIDVSWTGAVPTSGIQPDPNSAAAASQEYPMAILECRGTDSSSAPADQKVSPQTCWTHGVGARFRAISFSQFAPWRLDRYASAADRAAIVGRPSSPGTACGDTPAATEHWLPFISVSGQSYNYGNNGCAGLPPEDYINDPPSQTVPQNATFAPTNADGSGSAKFDVWTEAENASLGCSATVACTLEVIPIMGISCDPYGVSPDSAPLPAADIDTPDNDLTAATSFCEAGRNYDVGAAATTEQASLPVSGDLWWSASNWRNRISVPLNFAPVSNACDQVGGGAPVDVYGSELMTEATNQWAPLFCLDSNLFKFTHVQTSEPLARTLLNDPTSGVHAVFGAQPPPGGFSSPVVQAPVAVSGFSISYTIDGPNGSPVTNLRLDARLLAKLLTESYPEDDFDRFAKGQYPYLAGNPINITDDPEFQALNPGISSPAGFPGAATLIALADDSDVTTALTSYINADPEARAWLNGAADPWGMKVNQSYRGISLPVSRWPLLDTTIPNFADSLPCETTDPTPWLPLVATPAVTLAASTLAVQFAAPTGKTKCVSVADIQNAPLQYAPFGREIPGQRFVIGVTSLSEASRYDLQSAALQTQSSITDFTAKFTDASGRTFASPTADSMRTAVSALVPNSTTTTWSLPYDQLESNAKYAKAYPGTMVVYADVATKGLSSSDAKDYAALLRFAAGPGQQVGAGNGQLPTGYLPMTAANGLADEIKATLADAQAVQLQQGGQTVTPSSGHSTPAPTPTTTSTGPGSQPVTSPILPTGFVRPPSKPSSTPTSRSGSTPPPSSSSPTIVAVARIATPSHGVGLGGGFLPVLLIAGVSAGLLAAVAGGTPRRRRPVPSKGVRS